MAIISLFQEHHHEVGHSHLQPNNQGLKLAWSYNPDRPQSFWIFILRRLFTVKTCFFFTVRTKRHLQERWAEHKYAIRKDNVNDLKARCFLEFHNNNPSTSEAFGSGHVPLFIQRQKKETELKGKPFGFIK